MVLITMMFLLKKYGWSNSHSGSVPFAIAAPLSSNILEWHYVVFGAPDTPYDGGYYHGKLIFPADFPFRPPSIYMITPSGRFQINTRLCLSISDFHPDTWNPSWTVSTIMMGLISFMNETAPTLGSLSTSDDEKRVLAKRSRDYNLRDKLFCEIFPELSATLREESEREQANSTPENEADRVPKPAAENRESSSLTANVLMIAGVVLLALAVRWVIINAS
uniref:Ubiquitin-conjugating enzyme E2 J2 n=1 Tax=Ditylenchus dipsaci TaxID=166011 RepID=A0A915E996_9BILA